MVKSKVSNETREVVRIAESYAKENSNNKIAPAHLLKALLHKSTGLIDFINAIESDYYYLLEWAEARMMRYSKANRMNETLEFDEKSIAVFDEADNYRLKFAQESIEPICILAAISTPGVGFTFEQLKTFPLSSNQIIESFLSEINLTEDTAGNGKKKIIRNQEKLTSLLNYTIDKTNLAIEGLIEPVIGMNKEMLMIFEIFGRKTKANVLIVGDSGVGKTSLINGIVLRINTNKVPSPLKGAKVFELDTGSLVAGANYKGEIEDRIKKILNEIKEFDKAILVIESISNIAEKHSSLSSIADLIKLESRKGELLILATSSIEGYTKNIEKDSDFERGFELIRLDEPNYESTYRILSEKKSIYENHHQLNIDVKVIHESIKLAKRFLNERCLPDSAFDLIDRTMSLINTTNDISKSEIEGLIKRLDSLKQLNSLSSEELNDELSWLYSETFSGISQSIISQIDTKTDFTKFQSKEEKIHYLEEILRQIKTIAEDQRKTINIQDVSVVVSQLSGIPIGKINTKERDKLINAEAVIKNRVVGQDHAIKTIIEAIYESRSGLKKKGQPIGSFFFLGPTGTGKTELAKALAEFLFEDESSMIRFDMSEFKEEHSAALLYGAPPGYVGYEEGGLLVNKIRQKPYSVVLFDEIEKAHKSVFDIFLQILDEGKLHDRLGKEGDFSNSLVLFTSNIGSDFIFKSFQQQKIPTSIEMLDIMVNYFRPEFLGRLTEIIPFAPISEKIVSVIFDIHLKGLLKGLDEMEITLEIDPKAKKKLAASGFNAQYGARPIIGVIRNHIRRPLSKLIIAGKIGNGSKVKLVNSKDEYKWIY
jgi:ATP-dependent Clp protease ATP-binding subunit ClpB